MLSFGLSDSSVRNADAGLILYENTVITDIKLKCAMDVDTAIDNQKLMKYLIGFLVAVFLMYLTAGLNAYENAPRGWKECGQHGWEWSFTAE
ncbi:MAG: hypothetical protein WDN67_00735 [Candidatus Moraniibacteriota bacterium]